MRPDTIDVRAANGDITTETSPTYSNPIQLNPTGQYVFVTEPEASYQNGYVTGSVLVLNGDSTSSNFNQVVATIPVGIPGTTPNPIQVAVTPDDAPRAPMSPNTATAASR